MTYPIEPPVSPMLAKLARELPSSGGKLGDLLYEPKWDGFRAIVFRDGDDVEIGSRNEKPLTRYFPDLVEPLKRNLPDRCVVDGEVVIATERGLDFDRLSLRIHPAESRVAMLAEETPAAFVAFDLLAQGDADLRGTPFRERRARLEQVLNKAKAPVFLTPATNDRDTAGQWFEHFEGAGLDGVIAKPLDGEYEEGKRTMLKVKHLRTADCVVGGFRFHKDGEGVGSLLLGLYDDDGVLHHVGVASSFSAEARRELLADLEPHRDGALDEHPWRGWAEAEAGTSGGAGAAGQRRPGAQSRWNAGKDLSWEPLRLGPKVGLVAEVAYEHMQGDRFRHTARFQRWRPDREPSSCTYEQLEVPVPMELLEIFGL
jgi:ATP-dependent DNA ligase